MNREFETLSARIRNATCPEDVFGEIGAQTDAMLLTLKQRYRAYVKIVHPDVYQGTDEKAAAQSTFRLLTAWMARAEGRIKTGKYGSAGAGETILLRTPKREYEIEGAYVEDGIYNSYACTFLDKGQLQSAQLKVVRDPCNNPLAENEIRALRTLSAKADSNKFSPYLPQLLDAFIYDNGASARQALVLKKESGWFSLSEVHAAYPDGIDPRDMAWIWRRLLVILGYAHRSDILHGAVLPENVWVLPEEHGLMLGGWSSALSGAAVVGTHVPLVSQTYHAWYPQDVLWSAIPLFPADILMSAKCMLWLLGGDPHTKMIPKTVPNALRAFLRGCILPLSRAPRDAWKLLEEFDELLAALWGPRKFHPFRISIHSQNQGG